MTLHRFEEGLPPELCRFEAHRATDESDLTVSKLKKVFNRFMNALFIIDSDVAGVRTYLSDVEKDHSDFPRGQALDHGKIHLRGQNHDAPNSQFQQTLHVTRVALRLVIRIKNNNVVAQLQSSFLNGFHKVRKELVGNVRNDQSQRPALARRQIARMDVGRVPDAFNGVENLPFGVITNESSLVYDVRNKTRFVSDDTKRKVLYAIERVGYTPNIHARNLASGQSRTLGLIISDITNPFFPDLVKSIHERALELGYDVIVLNTNYEPERDSRYVQRLLELRVRGVMILTTEMDLSVIERLSSREIAVVFLDIGK